MLTRQVYTLEEAFRCAVDIEQYMKATTARKVGASTGEFSKKLGQTPFGFKSGSTATTTDKGKKPMSGSASASKPSSITCFVCGKTGHYMNQCPQRVLFLSSKTNAENEEEIEDSVEEDDVDPMEEVASVVEEDIESSQLAVMRCIIATPKIDPDWRRTAIFHMYFKCGEINCKLIIDSGSCMNVLAMSAIARMKLKAETHPQPYKVAWVNETMIPVTQRCLVPIQLGTYSEKIWCDVLPMNIAHVLLGRPWLYDRDVIHYGRSNTYTFTFKGKKVKLNPAKPKEP
ncbi:hypothetical protein AXF42_Ash012617 [Apostasia shenzhenica]|uniref:CCHC-type domain-containing protein n=1 Tax=Apostasia shenzhenica TaxID=1088818 RepID=A0A2H9ZT68_9ASPA|nr:hypothetical protein AXF42_Ash012617 [Apostasia shenzhenica]